MSAQWRREGTEAPRRPRPAARSRSTPGRPGAGEGHAGELSSRLALSGRASNWEEPPLSSSSSRACALRPAGLLDLTFDIRWVNPRRSLEARRLPHRAALRRCAGPWGRWNGGHLKLGQVRPWAAHAHGGECTRAAEEDDSPRAATPGSTECQADPARRWDSPRPSRSGA